jgi:hypothetical protein
MSRKLSSVVAVLAFLSLSLAGAAQARPLVAPAATPSNLFQQICRWLSSNAATIATKTGVEMDPNGHKSRITPPLGMHGAGKTSAQVR